MFKKCSLYTHIWYTQYCTIIYRYARIHSYNVNASLFSMTSIRHTTDARTVALTEWRIASWTGGRLIGSHWYIKQHHFHFYRVTLWVARYTMSPCACRKFYHKSLAVAEMGDCLATIGMGRKWAGAAVGGWVRTGFPSNTDFLVTTNWPYRVEAVL